MINHRIVSLNILCRSKIQDGHSHWANLALNLMRIYVKTIVIWNHRGIWQKTWLKCALDGLYKMYVLCVDRNMADITGPICIGTYGKMVLAHSYWKLLNYLASTFAWMCTFLLDRKSKTTTSTEQIQMWGNVYIKITCEEMLTLK